MPSTDASQPHVNAFAPPTQMLRLGGERLVALAVHLPLSPMDPSDFLAQVWVCNICNQAAGPLCRWDPASPAFLSTSKDTKLTSF